MVKICDLTLKVKHLPNCLSDNEKEEFMKHFGAQQIKVITSLSKQKSVVYGKFETKQIAKVVLHRIHQLKVLDAVLCVEFAEKHIADALPAPLITQPAQLPDSKHFVDYITKINSLNSAVGFDQPPPGHLRYSYPKANRATINNISYALNSVPQFYYQVLHLMNRLNLPPPFSNAPDSTMQQPRVQKHQKQTIPKSESESELESDTDTNEIKDVIPTKRRLPQSKPIKRPKFIKPLQISVGSSSSSKENVEQVFEKNDLKQHRIELKVTADCLENKNNSLLNETNVETREFLIVGKDSGDVTPENNLTILTDQELAANRLALKDLYVLPVFKDYHPGTPNCRLYIKNIARTAGINDLERIYKRYYVEKPEGQPNMFEIKHMTEGRMKDQAFITLDTIELAQKAVKETNGYILKEKPLVVVFAKTMINKK